MDQMFHIEHWMLLLFLSEKLGSKITAIHVMENVPTVYIQSQKTLDELLEARKNESQKNPR